MSQTTNIGRCAVGRGHVTSKFHIMGQGYREPLMGHEVKRECHLHVTLFIQIYEFIGLYNEGGSYVYAG